MSVPNDSPAPEQNDIQFDQAEFMAQDHQGPSCTACKSPISDDYFEAGGKMLCVPCRERIEAHFHGGPRPRQAFMALILGSVAAAAGAMLYYAILKLTGWNIGLVSVVVGLMVGGAVRNGSGGRGGWFYQLLAVFLTYCAIAAMFVPFMLEGIEQARKQREQAEAVFNKVDQEPGEAKAEAEEAVKSNPRPVKLKRDLQPNPVRGFVLAAGFIVIAFAGPIIISVHNPISGLIFGFALWEAWKINRKVRLSFNGPFHLGAGRSDAPVLEVPHDEP
jgi:hypothetical protein